MIFKNNLELYNSNKNFINDLIALQSEIAEKEIRNLTSKIPNSTFSCGMGGSSFYIKNYKEKGDDFSFYSKKDLNQNIDKEDLEIIKNIFNIYEEIDKMVYSFYVNTDELPIFYRIEPKFIKDFNNPTFKQFIHYLILFYKI